MKPHCRPIEYAYLHGFASGPKSTKGIHLRSELALSGRTLHIPDLNPPRVEEITYTGLLAAFDNFASTRDPSAAWGLVGSSMGGIIAARWAELNPDRVHRLVLLAPGFDLPRRWRAQLGVEGVRDWQDQGFVGYTDPDGTDRQVHWGLMEDASSFDPFPSVRCPTLILHGRQDETVTIESSRAYAVRHRNVTLIELEDDHRLISTLDQVTKKALEFLLAPGRELN